MAHGERFELNLDDDGDFLNGPSLPSGPTFSFVKDIIEKPATAVPVAPTLPSLATSTTGFPEHKKRNVRQSAFRQRVAANATPPAPPPLEPSMDIKTEKQKISDENQRRIDAMSPEEIEEQRRELMSNLSPSLLEAFLRRATLDDENVNKAGWNTEGSKLSRPMRGPVQQPAHPQKAEEKTKEQKPPAPTVQDEPEASEAPAKLTLDERAPLTLPVGETLKPSPAKLPIHFPHPPESQDLDPEDPDFLTHLHEKYYPDLPSDPTKLSWMAPIKKEEDEAYHPKLESLPPSALRFDFKGNLLPPRSSRELPSHMGLHHHGDAPAAAGYTIPELSHLARSSFPSQRCIAMQTLGRIMFRLGKGLYGNEDINQGLWRCLHEGRVLDGLEEGASVNTPHMGVRAYATEALWNWQQGGGQRWKAD
ncbi:RPAP1-like protein [Peziza echinospora]|nr:RPAP1-like protein [Peziza echinospora]